MNTEQIDEDLESDSGEESCSSDEDINTDEGEDNEEDDSEDEYEEQLNEGAENHKTSDVSDGDPEKECCPICLNRFLGQELGTPENCEHTFCFECIQEWSKNINTCPVDRTEFNFISVRNTPGGKVLKRVRSKVLPKEPEDTFEEGVTLCEICRSGEREERLLLCDGCDLAYHCECLDPPLFYIPIEEWFCPTCSGVFQNGAVAGPSRRTRRVIPRTRASEAVRSRVQRLRTMPSSSASQSTSRNSHSVTNRSPKKRRRRTYKRTYKKVVQLARTKKSISGIGKDKLASRGDTIVLTYRKRRRRRRRVKRLSKRSIASSKSLPVPSAQQRIAKRLGISKPPSGSAIPQVKQSSNSHSVTRTAKLPSHSIFGDRNQLMDFSENFNEDFANITATSSSLERRLSEDFANTPSTSSSLGRRISEDSHSSSTSSVNILDSIMAGQTILHSKSENIVIKTDGSLVLKKSDANKIKTVNAIKTPAVSQSSRTPMSIALAKEGVKSLVLPSNSKSSILSKNVSKTSQLNSQSTSISKFNGSGKTSCGNTNADNQLKVKNDSASYKMYSESTKSNISYFCDNQSKKNGLSTFKIPKRTKEKITKEENCAAVNIQDTNNVTKRLECNIMSDLNCELSYKSNSTSVKREISYSIKKERKKNTNLSSESSSSTSVFKSGNFMQKHSVNRLVPAESFKSASDETSAPVSVKKEVMSDEETNSDSFFHSVESINVKQEVLSDEETNMDCSIRTGISSHTVEKDGLVFPSKTGDTDSGSETDASDGFNNGIQLGSNASESEDSTFEPSQSIIDSVSYDSINSLQPEKKNSEVPSVKIKEELPSDTEDYSQSIVSDSVAYIESESMASRSKSPEKDLTKCVIKDEKLYTESLNLGSRKSKFLSNDTSEEDDLPCTQLAFYPVTSNIQNFCSSTSLNKKLSSNYQVCNKEDKEFPATQVSSEFNQTMNSHTSADQTYFGCKAFKDLPETPSIPSTSKLSSLPATQLFNDPSKEITNLSDAGHSSSDDESDILPATQMFSTAPVDNLSDSECSVSADNVCGLPATQVYDTVLNMQSNLSSENVLLANKSSLFPDTQVFNDKSKEMHVTQAYDNFTNMSKNPDHTVNETSKNIDLPSTQVFAVNNSTDLPATQIFNEAPCHVPNESIIKSASNELASNTILCPDGEENDPGININDIISNIKQVVNNYITGKNPDISCTNNNPETKSKESASLKPHATDNTLESNLNNNNKDSEISSTLNNNKDVNENFAVKNNENSCNAELDKGPECQHNSTDSENEEISPEKLKEIRSKSTKIDSPKNVGIHKHLPQVITVKPVKGQPRPKPPNRKTFSFEEVAKLEGPNTMIDLQNKVDKSRLCENSAEDSHESDQDITPLTQKANSFNRHIAVSSTEIACDQDDLPATQANNSVTHLEDWDLPGTQANNSVTHLEDWDLPGTQVVSWKNSHLDVSETQIMNVDTGKAEHLLGNQIISKDLNMSVTDNKKNLNPRNLKKSVKFCTIKTNSTVKAKNKNISSKTNANYDTEECTDFIESQDLPATQIFSSEHSVRANNNTHLEDWDFPATQAASWQNNDLDVPETRITNAVVDSKKNFNPGSLKKSVKFSTVKTGASIEVQNKSTSSETNINCGTEEKVIELDNLPATQIFNDNHSVFVNKKVNQQGTLSGENKEIQHISSTFKLKNKMSDIKRSHKHGSSEVENITGDHNKGLKRSNGDKSSDKLTKKFKETVANSFNSVKENEDSNRYKVSDYCKTKLFNGKTTIENNSFKKNNLSEIQTINIKQEKTDASDFKKPLPVINNKLSEFGVPKIKSENIFGEDVLPSTQLAVSNNSCDDMDLPATQIFNYNEVSLRNNTDLTFSLEKHSENTEKSNLSSIDIKTEVLSDDEISVIELDLTSGVEVKKEVITIDDDDNCVGSSCGLTSNNVNIGDETILMNDDNIRNTDVKIKKEKLTNEYDVKCNETNVSNILNCDIYKGNITIKAEKNIEGYKSSTKMVDSSSKKVNAPPRSESENLKTTSQLSSTSQEINRSRTYENKTVPSKYNTEEVEDLKKCKTTKDSVCLEKNKPNKYDNGKHENRVKKCTAKETEKYKASNNSCLDKQDKQKKIDDKYLKSKSSDFKSKHKDIEKCKNGKESSSLKGKNEQESLKKQSLNFKDKISKKDHEDSKSQKVPKDSSLKKKSKQKEYETNSADLKIRSNSRNSIDVEKNKNVKNYSCKERKYSSHNNETLKSKTINASCRNTNELKMSTKRESNTLDIHEEISNSSLSSGHTRNSSEKENNSCKIKNSNKEMVTSTNTLKPTSKKRLSESVESGRAVKKQKYEKLQQIESFSSSDTSQQSPILLNGSLKDSNSIIKLDANCDTDNSNIKNHAVESFHSKDLVRMSKQELKEEIANEVKMVLKPFFSTGLISKEDYKDIMRRAVPKIFINCHNSINPEKIRKLVLSYVSLLNKS